MQSAEREMIMDSLVIRGRTLISVFIAAALLLLLAIVCEFNVLLTVCLLIWTVFFAASLINIEDNVVLFCFLISFFVFLLGRQVVYSVFERNEVYSFLDVTNNAAYLALIVSLLFLAFGSWMARQTVFIHDLSPDRRSALARPRSDNSYAMACRLVFYICLLFSFVEVVYKIRFVRRVGYLASYTTAAGGSGVPTFVTYFAAFTPVALSLYLASFPSKKASMKELVLYEIYGLMTLLTGQRYPFIGISMFILSYMVIRNRMEKGWVKKSYYVMLALAIPVLMILLAAYDAIRLGEAFDFRGAGNAVVEFLDQQGGSINTIRRTIYHADDLKDMHLVSLGGTYSALFENIIARVLFGVQTYSGNSMERALAGHDYSARLSLIVYGDGYLQGHGAGSSYIAELLHDFGLVGVAIGSFFYGYVLRCLNRLKPGKELLGGIGLAMMYCLYLAPRGGFDAFVGSVFRIYSFFFFFVIIVLSWIIRGTSWNR